jgi:hypothetical protein
VEHHDDNIPFAEHDFASRSCTTQLWLIAGKRCLGCVTPKQLPYGSTTAVPETVSKQNKEKKKKETMDS